MKLKTIEANPTESLIYLDRYVNDGSPSGFTEINKTSPKTDTFSLNRGFSLLTIESNESNFKIYGSLKEDIPLESTQFYVHPDMKDHSDLSGCSIKVNTDFQVSPTSSFRTVKILSHNCDDFIKLHYAKVLGRIIRKLNSERAIAGVEISKIVSDALQQNLLSEFISVYQEPFAKIFKNPTLTNEKEFWGMVWRNAKPFGNRSERIEFTIPLFSFWSKDRQQENDESFGSQIFKHWGKSAKENLITQILIPALDTYFEFVTKLGLQNEYNAQNILIGFDKSWNAVSIILRDMMGIEKDLDIRKSLGLSTSFDSSPYKIISSADKLYHMRHSFTFDFKVCKYVIEPLIELAVANGLSPREDLLEIMRVRTKYWLEQLPSDYLPKGVWFSHDNVDISVKANRVYEKNKNPLLRN